MRMIQSKCVMMSLVIATAAATLLVGGCSTAPKTEDQASFRREADTALDWFKDRVPGVDRQIENSAGYVIFPSVGQWGIIFGGGKYGRGLVAEEGGEQVGWAAIKTGSVGLQAGVQGFKMLMVFEDDWTMNQFRQNKLTGSVGATAVAVSSGGAKATSFTDGVAMYQGAQSGLMAGVNVGFDYIKFKPLSAED